MNGQLTPEQHKVLMRPLNPSRVAKRQQGGKQLSYLEAYDVRAHLLRIFGFGGFDAKVLDCELIYQRDATIGTNKTPGWEVAYKVEFQLIVRDQNGDVLAEYIEAAVGSASGATGLGDLHDNAAKSASSDALKRCAINLGSQFGLSLYDNGSTSEVVKHTLVVPEGAEPDPPTLEQVTALKKSLGAQVIETKEENNAGV